MLLYVPRVGMSLLLDLASLFMGTRRQFLPSADGFFSQRITELLREEASFQSLENESGPSEFPLCLKAAIFNFGSWSQLLRGRRLHGKCHSAKTEEVMGGKVQRPIWPGLKVCGRKGRKRERESRIWRKKQTAVALLGTGP